MLADLGRLREGGIRILTIPGNHDEYSYPACVYRSCGRRWPDRLVTNPLPERVDTWTLAGHEVDLYAMTYVAGRSRPPYDRFEMEAGPRRKIVALHGSLDFELSRSDRSLPLRSESLAALGADYVALGHIHRPMEKRLARGWACYPGRIEGGGFDDPGGADLVLIDLADPEPGPCHVPITSRRIVQERWSVSAMESAGHLERRLEEKADPGLILRLQLDGIPGFAIELEELRRRWAPRFHHLDLQREAGPLADVSLDELSAERTIRGRFAEIAAGRLAEARDEDERSLREAALRLGLAAFASRDPERSE